MSPFKKPVVPRTSLADQLDAVMCAGSTKRILLLDDDSTMRELVALISRDYDVAIFEAHTTTEARLLIEQQGPFDLAVLDVNVANGNGLTLYQWIMEAFPRLPVAFFTGYASPLLEKKIHEIGSAPIYSKPLAFTRQFFEDFLTKLGARKRSTA